MSQPDLSNWQHSHSFGQDKRRPGETRTLIVIVVTASMMVVEIAAGIMFGSIALLADGLHMASHAVALGINAFAYHYTRRHAHDERFSFGTGKVNSLGGYSGAVLLGVFAVMMAWESVHRFLFPTEIIFNSAIAVAVIGLVVNGASVFILGGHDHHDHDHDHDHDHHHHHDHNLRSAYLHVLADALTSLTAIVALLCAKYFGWIWMDPLMGILGSLLVAHWSLGLLRSSGQVLLDFQATPKIQQQIRDAIEGPGEARIADLHVWRIGPGIFSVIMTIISQDNLPASAYRERLNHDFFQHVTIEIQTFPPSS